MAVALQIKDVREEVRDAVAARAAARGQSMQVYLRELLEREFRAEHNKRLFEGLAPHRTLALDVDDVVEYIRGGRADDPVIVVDASAMVFALSSPTAQGDAARSAMTGDDTWIGPAHMPLEVIRTLRKAVVGGHLTEDDATAAYTVLMASEITYVGASESLLRAVWAMRHNVSAHDAAYLAIAAEYGARLVAFDARLVKAAEQVIPFVSVLKL